MKIKGLLLVLFGLLMAVQAPFAMAGHRDGSRDDGPSYRYPSHGRGDSNHHYDNYRNHDGYRYRGDYCGYYRDHDYRSYRDRHYGRYRDNDRWYWSPRVYVAPDPVIVRPQYVEEVPPAPAYVQTSTHHEGYWQKRYVRTERVIRNGIEYSQDIYRDVWVPGYTEYRNYTPLWNGYNWVAGDLIDSWTVTDGN